MFCTMMQIKLNKHAESKSRNTHTVFVPVVEPALLMATPTIVQRGASDMASYGYRYSNRYRMPMSNRLKFIVPDLKLAECK